MLPEPVRRAVEAELGPIREARPVAGGCISSSLRIELGGGSAFLKYGSGSPGLFASEARGLEALRAGGSGLRIPAVLAVHDSAPGGFGWLALEWLEPGERAAGFGVRLGSGLAALHRAGHGGWGWERDGYIGSLAQCNAPTADWARFWGERRIGAQLRLAREAGRMPGSDAQWDRLLAQLPESLAAAERDGPSLLHGDLWSGNVIAVPGGEPALVDPAVYRGHREVDLAMSELFGGFAPDFYTAYREAWPLLPGYEEVRRGVYQLFYLLVHVNLFGGGYIAQTAALLRRLVATL